MMANLSTGAMKTAPRAAIEFPIGLPTDLQLQAEARAFNYRLY
jgi:hypothetical protein